MSYYHKYDEWDSSQTYDPDKDYNAWELGQLADDLLKQDARTELCRKCDKPGVETGRVESMPQVTEDGDPVTDEEGNVLYVEFPEYECPKQHRWYRGEGTRKGIGGDNPILFENHLQDRRRREIYVTVGTPDPSIVAGLYNRSHPQGRKINSDKQRRVNGASYYR